jgi:transcriptional regulator with XRE-family HTH domain
MRLDTMTKKQSVWQSANPLRKYRVANGITQSQAASLLGVTTTTIQHWEAGNFQPDDSNLQKIGVFMRTPDIDRLWGDWLSTRPRLVA